MFDLYIFTPNKTAEMDVMHVRALAFLEIQNGRHCLKNHKTFDLFHTIEQYYA